MATHAHCAYCFETLAASFENRHPLTLAQVESLWDGYANNNDTAQPTTSDGNESSRTPAISRLLSAVTPSSSSPSSPSSTTNSTASSVQPSTAASSSSSRTSLTSSSSTSTSLTPSSSCPLFITWNLVSLRTHKKSLRGCIGTFSPQPLSQGLSSYALTSAFEDSRFPPIPSSQLSQLQVCVTLLTNFSAKPTSDPMAWEIGKNGIRISFMWKGRRLGATYLPDVAVEQEWTKEEAIVSLMRKAGWNGKKEEWRKVDGFELITYEGEKVVLEYAEFRQWRDWVGKRGVKAGK